MRASKLARGRVKTGGATPVVVAERILDSVVLVLLLTISLLRGSSFRTPGSGYMGLIPIAGIAGTSAAALYGPGRSRDTAQTKGAPALCCRTVIRARAPYGRE